MTTEGTPRSKGRNLRRWLALPLAAGFALALAAPAQAAFPGANGKIVFNQNVPNPNVDFEIFSVDPDGSNLTNLTNNPAFDGSPDWSPDGTKIAFVSGSGVQAGVYVMDADGANPTLVPNTQPARTTSAGVSWSPDGTKIAFPAIDGALAQINVINADGTGKTAIGPTGAIQGIEWSPDGTKIAFGSDHGAHADQEIYVMNAVDGSNVTRLTTRVGDDRYPDWSPDSSRIIWESTGPVSDLMIMDAAGTNQQPVGALGTAFQPAFSPDGTKIAYGAGGFVRTIAPDGTGVADVVAASARQFDWQPVEQPDLRPIEISKQTISTGVEGRWTWKMGKWTTSKLEQKATGPRPYTFKVLVDSHGFKIKHWRVASRVTLTNPNDVPISGTLADVLPGFSCTELGGVHPTPVQIPANGNLQLTTLCTTGSDPGGPVTNTATFTLDEAHEAGPQPVSESATTTIDETPPPSSPGQKVALRDPMWHNGKKVLRYLDAVNGPWSITATYTVKLIPPVTPGKCWWHHNTAHLRDVASGDKVARSNRVSVYICRPKDAPKGTKPKDLPKTDKHGIPIVTPRLGGPKSIPAKYRTRLRTRVMAPRRVFRGQAFRVKVTTRNLTKKRAYGTIVKVKIPKGLRVATRARGIKTRGRYAYWTVKALGPKRKLTRTLRLVAIRPGAKRIVAISNARNAKRSGAKKVVRVLRPRRDVS